jgi:hypothetical protein
MGAARGVVIGEKSEMIADRLSVQNVIHACHASRFSIHSCSLTQPAAVSAFPDMAVRSACASSLKPPY